MGANRNHLPDSPWSNEELTRLFNGSPSWSSSSQSDFAATQVTYGFPSTLELEALRLARPSFVQALGPILDTDEQNYVRHTFKIWEQYANIEFVEVAKERQIPVYKFAAEINVTVQGYGSRAYYQNLIFNLNQPKVSDRIGLNQVMFNHLDMAEMIHLILHEQAHSGFGLDHYFDVMPNQQHGKNFTSYSVTNYQHETILFGGKKFEVIPLSPMLLDIAAAQHRYGVNTNIRLDNNIYNFADVVHEDVPGNKIYTIRAFPWNNGGVDTLDASKIRFADHQMDRTVKINLLPYTRSQIGTHLFVMPAIEIENIVAMKGEVNDITLNTAPNLVDLRGVKSAVIHVDPTASGHDTIIGFDPNTTTIDLARLPADNFELSHTVFSSENNNKGLQQQATIYFNQNNSITFIGVKPDDLRSGNIVFGEQQVSFFKSHNVTQVVESVITTPEPPVQPSPIPVSDNKPRAIPVDQAENESVNISSALLADVFSAFLSGMGMTYIQDKLREQLKEEGCSPQKIKYTILAVQAVLTLVTGSHLSTGASLATSTLLSYLGVSQKNCMLAGNLASIGVKAASNFTLFGLARTSLCVASGFAGSWITRRGRDYMSKNQEPILPTVRPDVARKHAKSH